MEGDLEPTHVKFVSCPYLARWGGFFYCEASIWGLKIELKDERKVGKPCFRPLIDSEVFLCLKHYFSCPDFKKMKFYERKAKSEF